MLSGLRIVLAAVVGGILIFVWGAVSHMVLPIGKMGLNPLPPEPGEALVASMRKAIPNDGFFYFPGDKEDATEAEQEAWWAKYEKGPRGLVLMDSAPVKPFWMKLATELLSNIAFCVLVALVLMRMKISVGAGAIVATIMSVGGWIAIDVSYWNWYSFPGAFAMASFVEQTIGGLLAGAAIGRIMRQPPLRAEFSSPPAI